MSFAPSSPVTGGPQTGLTSPTYTLTADTAPSSNGKQYAITALGGTQTGVDVHSISKPFTMACFRPATFRTLGSPDSNGNYKPAGRNLVKIVVRKGVNPAANQAAIPLIMKLEISCPAGADSYDAIEVRAALSLLFGTVWASSSAIGDVCITGILG